MTKFEVASYQYRQNNMIIFETILREFPKFGRRVVRVASSTSLERFPLGCAEYLLVFARAFVLHFSIYWVFDSHHCFTFQLPGQRQGELVSSRKGGQNKWKIWELNRAVFPKLEHTWIGTGCDFWVSCICSNVFVFQAFCVCHIVFLYLPLCLVSFCLFLDWRLLTRLDGGVSSDWGISCRIFDRPASLSSSCNTTLLLSRVCCCSSSTYYSAVHCSSSTGAHRTLNLLCRSSPLQHYFAHLQLEHILSLYSTLLQLYCADL